MPAQSDTRPNVLLIVADPVGPAMPGPAIRGYELARALRPYADVTLAGLEAEGDPPEDVRVIRWRLADPSPLRSEIDRADVVVSPPPWPVLARWLVSSGARLVYDLSVPTPLEVLEFTARRAPLVRSGAMTLTLDRFLAAMLHGHHLICASEKQRDLWLGAMLAARVIRPGLYDRDPTFRDAIDTVPFGLPEDPPVRGDGGPRASFPRIAETDEVVLWNGGLWNWLDAPTAIRAVGRLAERRPGVRLVFMGASQAGAGKEAAEEARAIADQLGLLGDVVLFNDVWVPYGERAAWLLEADCAVSTHVEHLETRFAFRTRVLDCLWAGLPVVCTRGDELADRIEAEDLGATVKEGDHEALAGQLHRVLERGRASYSSALARAAEGYRWPRVARPLVRFVTAPDEPPRLGLPGARRPAHAGRDLAFRSGLRSLNRLGLRPWPSL